MKIPCHDCTVASWGACRHQEFGDCLYVNFKEANMDKIYSKKELQDMNAFDLWSIAEKMKVVNFEHLPQWDLIEAVIEKQEELTINQ